MSAQPIRVACLGGSITFGFGLRDRRQESYPTVLGEMLGPGFRVRNFGHSGAAAGRATNLAYWDTPSFTAATRFDAQLVVIALGTNDAQAANRGNLSSFSDDLIALAEHFRKLPSAREIVLVLPPPVFDPLPAIDIPLLNDFIRPAIVDMSETLALPLVDGYTPLAGRPDLFPDNLHPNAQGARMLAEAVHDVVRERLS